MPKPYKNKEYIDWVRQGQLLVDTVEEGPDRVTLPEKMLVRDMGLFVYGVFNGASVIPEFSPEFMETPKEDLIPANMKWFSRTDGIYTAADLLVQNFWENLDAAEGWLRFRIINIDPATDLFIATRPRIEAAI